MAGLNPARWGVAAGLLVCLASSFAWAATKQRALLVGCTVYPHLEESLWLQGPANDVALLRRLITGHPFYFDPAEVTSLAGWPPDEKLRPTRGNILRELRRLADRSRSGDQVVILLAGHGSQQPADEDPEDQEPDGLDEIFLPADVVGWDGEQGAVKNALVDDELGAALTAILKKDASVWLIVDACFSGTLTRGAPRELQRERRLPADRLVPGEELDRARRGVPRTRGRPSPPVPLDGVASRSNLVATFAAQPDEPTPELPLPDSRAPYHGLFSHTIVRVLDEAASPLTYRELSDRVTIHYRSALGRFHPTPLLQGGGLDREVLGSRTWPDRPRMLLGGPLAGDERRFRLRAGYLQGLRPGSVLRVYPPAGSAEADKPLGHVRVVTAAALESEVEAASYDGLEAPASTGLVEGARCSLVFVDFGDQQTRVALQSGHPEAAGFATHAAGTGPAHLERAMARLVKDPSGLVRRVSDPRDADWFVRRIDDRVVLVPASGWPGAAGVPARFDLGAVEHPQELASGLGSAMLRIARVRHLLRLAGDGAWTGRGDLDIEVELLEIDGARKVPVRPGPGGRVLRPGDEIAFRVTNHSRWPVDVNLLFVDSGYGILAVLPRPGGREDNRLAPGRSLLARGKVNAETLGPEQLVAIAVKARGSRADLSFLEQPTLEATVTRGDARPEPTPLTRLLERALYGKGTLRGLRVTEISEYTVQLLSWTVVPKTKKERRGPSSPRRSP